MELVSRSFRLERGSSLKQGRSNSSLLISESLSSECARVASYQRLSESMRMDGGYRRKKHKASGFISKVFRIISGYDRETAKQRNAEATEEDKRNKKKWSSWLPDPERRWPVQGW